MENNKIQVFNNLKVKEVNGQVMFDAETVAIGIGLTEKEGYVRWQRLNKYLKRDSPEVEKIEKGDFITEPEMYTLAIKVNTEKAENFQHWVTHEVLPSIRKNGVYMTDQKAYDITHNPDSLADLLLQAGEQLKHKELIIKEMIPKALFADSVSASHTSILIGDLAKLIKQNGVDIGQNKLFQWLRDNGYLIKRKGESWNMPTQRSLESELFEVKEKTFEDPNGSIRITKTTKVTGKGQIYFVNKFLGKK